MTMMSLLVEIAPLAEKVGGFCKILPAVPTLYVVLPEGKTRHNYFIRYHAISKGWSARVVSSGTAAGWRMQNYFYDSSAEIRRHISSMVVIITEAEGK